MDAKWKIELVRPSTDSRLVVTLPKDIECQLIDYTNGDQDLTPVFEAITEWILGEFNAMFIPLNLLPPVST